LIAGSRKNVRNFYLAIALVIGVLFVGTFGYYLIEDLALLDAVYMAVITIATVGFEEVKPGGFTPAGRIFTIFLIFFAIGVGTYGVGSIIAFIVEGRLRHAIRRKRMEKEIENLSDHYVIAGIGKTGWEVVNELERVGEPYVVIDIDPEKIERLLEIHPKALAIRGNATEESVLEEAGIGRARAMICSLPDDAENIVAVLTARGLKLDLLVISRGMDEESVRKLRRAGADQVILPAQIAGIRMASFAVRPHICDFLDFVMRGKDVTLRMEEIILARDSIMAGKPLRESRIREESGAIVIGVRHKEDLIINPPVDLVLSPGDTLILLGTEDQLADLYRYMKVER